MKNVIKHGRKRGKKPLENVRGKPKIIDDCKFEVVTILESGEETTSWFTIRELMDMVSKFETLPQWEKEYLRKKING